MNKYDLQYDFPEELIAKEPIRPSRICSALVNRDLGSFVTSFSSAVEGPLVAEEVNWEELLGFFQPDDVLVLNNTKVLKRRVFTSEGLEILFLNSLDFIHWEVLFPSKRYKVGQQISLPGGVHFTLLAKGRPQKVKTSQALIESYFEAHGELPLPPYIQKARGERHTQEADESWYQTAWSEKPGSFAAPTASLHFTHANLNCLKQKGVHIESLTLHVGLGTFLPVKVNDLREHIMHKELVQIPQTVIVEIEKAKARGNRVWAMGTTVMRALEAYGAGHLKWEAESESYVGQTDLLILPGFEFKMVNRLLTNFHQPESTLLALVMAFAGVKKVKEVYRWAIHHQFRLFSYGDLSVWELHRSRGQI